MIRNEKGSSIILIAVAMTVLLSVVALVVDLGLAFSIKSKMQNTVDAAALAGIQELPSKTGKAMELAKDYIKRNGFDQNSAQIVISPDASTITVTMNQTISYTFARIIGIESQVLGARAVAMTAPITGYRGIRPLGVENFPFVKGVVYNLKVGAGDSDSGNYGALALGDSGASIYENNLVYGYNSVIKIGDLIPTETGNMSTPTIRGIQAIMAACTHSPVCTYDHFAADCPRVIIIPLLNTLEVSGRKDVTVVGFSSFFLEGTQNSGGHTEVIGRFVETVISGEIDVGQQDYGARGVRLVQ